jgi:hypothetical protein
MAANTRLADSAADLGGYTPILNKLGTVKNQLLVFIILSAVLITGFAFPLSHSTITWKAVCGVIIHGITVFMLIGFGGFYAYATILLPANQQQLEFGNTVNQSVAEHESKRSVIHISQKNVIVE